LVVRRPHRFTTLPEGQVGVGVNPSLDDVTILPTPLWAVNDQGEIMETLYGFRVWLWEGMGFSFRTVKDFDGYDCKSGSAEFGTLRLNLRINPKFSIASVDNKQTNDTERHAVSEEDAIEWFSRASEEFKMALNTALHVTSSVRQQT
jgi:hypothetical protein